METILGFKKRPAALVCPSRPRTAWKAPQSEFVQADTASAHREVKDPQIRQKVGDLLLHEVRHHQDRAHHPGTSQKGLQLAQGPRQGLQKAPVRRIAHDHHAVFCTGQLDLLRALQEVVVEHVVPPEPPGPEERREALVDVEQETAGPSRAQAASSAQCRLMKARAAQTEQPRGAAPPNGGQQEAQGVGVEEELGVLRVGGTRGQETGRLARAPPHARARDDVMRSVRVLR